MSITLKPKIALDWTRLTWVLCSYCSAVIPEDDVPLIMSNDEGWTVRFCQKCMKDVWGME